MIRKKIDDKIKILLSNCINTNERAMFLIVGDKGRNQISNIHNFYTKLNPGKKLNILWCYKKELDFSKKAQSKMKKIKNKMRKGVLQLNDENAFDLFIASTDIKFRYYHDTQKVLGTTNGMLVLQDFEAITPNLLCRTIETVQGGGIIVFLLSNMTSLKQLYTITMDVHDRYRTESNQLIEPRFNERFILSLASCKNVLAVDDELNLLPITSHMKTMEEIEKKIDVTQSNVFISEREKELNEIKKAMGGKPQIGPLIELCKTVDQAKAIMVMVDAISEKNLKNTVSITSARGRGKSAAMGLAVSSAVVYGYSNIIVTAPSPENLNTFFEFVIKGLEALQYREKIDFTIQNGNGDFRGNIVSISITKNHKQVIRFILPSDILIFQMAEMVVIDEAAAIPLHIVKRIMPDALTFMASTVMGYEGTGRSLSIKLIDNLRNNQGVNGKVLKEVSLNQAIRYADNDAIEAWLNDLLLLDATTAEPFEESLVDPNKLELYYVNRDTLFSYHKASEAFLRKIMSLFVSSHYKNSPNDLQLLSDAPAHSIFVLCRSIEKSGSKSLPDVYCAIQVCEEGGISKDVILSNSKRGLKPSGDLIPWTISEHYQDNEFARMTGVRIVRIACHPEYTKMGYGSRALQLLSEYYEGKFINLEENKEDEEMEDHTQEVTDEKKKKKKLKPLLSKLVDIKPNFVYYLGTSFGLTKILFSFWNKNGYKPLYMKLTPNDITGEHSCIMIKPIREGNVNTIEEVVESAATSSIKWLNPFIVDFKHRFASLLAFEFKTIPIKLALSLLEPKLTTTTTVDQEENEAITKSSMKKNEIELFITKDDFKRMEKYAKNLSNNSNIIDLIPTLAKLFFNNKMNIALSYTQAGILLGIGLQYKSFDDIKEEFEVELNQLLAMFNKMLKKFCSHIRGIYEKEIEKEEEEISKKKKVKLNTSEEMMKKNEGKILSDIQEELKEEAKKVKEREMEDKRKYMEEKFKNMENLNKKRKRNDKNN